MVSNPRALGTASAARRSRRGDEDARPIASALALSESHLSIIEQSHERCAALGLSRIERPDHAPLGQPDLAILKERNLRLSTHAAPVMEMLFDQIAGTESMVVLCDAAGTVIHSIGDDDFVPRATEVALRPGVNWSEQAKGTNAIGTALIEEVPTLVHADEHFMHANHFLTCSAAPILDPRGDILGVLDVTGDHRGYHQHTMALVKMSARMIENHWLADDHVNPMRLHFHARVECIGTLMEGILAVAPDLRIVGANRSALEQLGMSGATLRMQNLVSLFGTTLGTLVDRFRSPLAVPMAVHAPNGRRLHLTARFNRTAWSHVSEVAPAVPEPPRAPAVAMDRAHAESGPGLRQLQTGDPQVRAVLNKVRRVLDRDIPVLILGETGTGKELLARAAHHGSARARQPFVAVNCAAIAEAMSDAELFGSEGAPGSVSQASGGTLFLDEIGELPLPVQARLLRVLQERRVRPLGGTEAQSVDIALVCASRRDLRDMIAAGRFREDLYYRLNGLAVKLPPLRERTDLAALVRRILDADRAGRDLRLSREVQELFDVCAWPGNVRQLGNVLRAAAALAGANRLITRDHLPDDFLDDVRRCPRDRAACAPPAVLRAPAPRPAAASTPAGPHGAASAGAGRSLAELELDVIRTAVEAAGGNISEAAKRLGVSRNTIYRKLRWNASA